LAWYRQAPWSPQSLGRWGGKRRGTTAPLSRQGDVSAGGAALASACGPLAAFPPTDPAYQGVRRRRAAHSPWGGGAPGGDCPRAVDGVTPRRGRPRRRRQGLLQRRAHASPGCTQRRWRLLSTALRQGREAWRDRAAPRAPASRGVRPTAQRQGAWAGVGRRHGAAADNLYRLSPSARRGDNRSVCVPWLLFPM